MDFHSFGIIAEILIFRNCSLNIRFFFSFLQIEIDLTAMKNRYPAKKM